MNLPLHLNGHSAEYFKWRERRLDELPGAGHSGARSTVIEVGATVSDPQRGDQYDFGRDQLADIRQQTRIHGFAHYRFVAVPDQNRKRQQVASLARALGLRRADRDVIAADDSLSLLEHRSDSDLARFPPYSNKLLNWHTDGYYNATDHTIRTFVLHCLQPADDGGELSLLDPELLLIAVYDHDPTIINHLTSPDAMTLPANQDRFGHHRPDRSVPVFFVHDNGTLGMRYTTRARNIHFRNGETMAAASRLAEMIDSIPQYQNHLRLQQCEGIVSRNILHRRKHYSDAPSTSGRQMLRGRYLDTPCGENTRKD